MTWIIADGADAPIWPTGQLVATLLTFALAAIALVWVALLCRRERIHWPALVLIGGTLTCLMEPLFDHLYGLRFREQGQWNLYTTFGSHQPVWVPAAYMAFYGGATVVIARVVTNKPAMRTVWAMYVSVALMAIVAEVTYISVLRVYEYQDGQPFVILGYPIFLGFTNAMSALVSGLIVAGWLPAMRGRDQLYLVLLVPSTFGAGLFGTGILYLSVRHSTASSHTFLVHVTALTVVAGIAATVGLVGRHVVAKRSAIGQC
ncbi:hypothetical protein O6072_06550 [Mycolicibacterium neoaurum]|uniref:hypothetical protein n=1 Tax=Mycolicibacterium neoaurum TaxID=1795 RepID=UPI00248BC2B7|nr:hypothetical protein [Mycolicibacterium neoaurum]MDO3401762.1 hypothetical protein [Mycolicibacterium neoaurum]WBP95837.1 hypothetical protein O7W24_06555 [Mycolicibacterium neoaurum]WBS09522.1 hypothetical protein O6072_06550 [Mycolicibacterium neoaurum]